METKTELYKLFPEKDKVSLSTFLNYMKKFKQYKKAFRMTDVIIVFYSTN